MESRYIVPVSNIPGGGPAAVGAYKGVGPYGTYDMAGNVREWVSNPDDNDNRFILGGSWKSPSYFYYSPETLSAFDRSPENGFRCVKNTTALPQAATAPIKRVEARDFAKYKPASDEVFRAYQVMYAPSSSPLHESFEGVVAETADWREEKVTLDTGYRGERIAVYLFLPKHVRPPYQDCAVLPECPCRFHRRQPKWKGAWRHSNFFDYIVQSGRAVVYPVYQDTYERRLQYSLPGGSQKIQLTTDRYRDAARALDYAATRSDLDKTKVAYLGVSIGISRGSYLYDRCCRTVSRLRSFLDGGLSFSTRHRRGGDQADFAPRHEKAGADGERPL